jgi:cell division protein FtsI (penicillin-binding protein 3)
LIAGSRGGELNASQRLVRLRLMILGLSLSLWALVIGVRLIHLQVFARDSLQRQALRQSERTIKLEPRRGRILDRSGRELAVSVDVESVYADPQLIPDVSSTARQLARVLDLDGPGERRLLEQLETRRAFAWVRRKVDPRSAQAVRALELPGVGFLGETRRYYPNRELGAHVLGWAGLDNKGMSGIEYAFDDLIGGRAAKVVVRTDAHRRPTGPPETPITEGQSVVLTIDATIQHVVERELGRAVRATRSVAGTAVVLDPESGEVLALANRPTFNPNRFGASTRNDRRNRAVLDAYEPGSVFKVITAAAALQEGVVTPDEIIDCGNGWIEIAGRRINDHKAFSSLAFRNVIARSSDIGTIRVAQRLGRETFNRYVHDFGFGSATEVGLPGEARGILRPPDKWSALSLASLSFGQEIGVTALQMANAIAVVANGGYLMRPRIVRRVESPSGAILHEYKPLAVRRVLEPETVDTLNEILREVVEHGTGRRAAVEGYSVAGKTGTAQKVDPHTGAYSMIDHVASFVGFVPATRPALVILVSLDTPQGERNEGGDVAAPVFQRIAEQSLRHLAIPPDDASRVLQASPYRQEPARRAAYDPGPAFPVLPEQMPDLRGRSAREAALAAARRGLVVELRGSGSVISQEPPPGARVEAGATCVLTLDPSAPDATEHVQGDIS